MNASSKKLQNKVNAHLSRGKDWLAAEYIMWAMNGDREWRDNILQSILEEPRAFEKNPAEFIMECVDNLEEIIK